MAALFRAPNDLFAFLSAEDFFVQIFFGAQIVIREKSYGIVVAS
jgi:hypothetical protein